MPRRKSSAKKKLAVRTRIRRTSSPVFSSIRPLSDLRTKAVSVWERLNFEAEANQSRLSMVLGALIILVAGILLFNYFRTQTPSLGPSQQAQNSEQAADVAPDNLPGKYTVKEGDTLFQIADKYYKDGYKYNELATANSLTNPDSLQTGQTLNIPKLADTTLATASEPDTVQTATAKDTEWGPAIPSDTYTVAEGDWLSKIAGRAYGDIFAFSKIAQANNISNPDLIEPGTVLKIPR